MKERRRTVCRRVSLQFGFLDGKHMCKVNHERNNATTAYLFLLARARASIEKKSKRGDLEVVRRLSKAG